MRHDFALEKFEKVKILVNIYVNKNYLQGLKNLKKNNFNVLEANLDENLIFEKSPNTKKFSNIFEILKLN
jgi:hypothetical protein